MSKLILGFAPALLLILAACGGGSETVAGDTATAAHTAAPTTEVTAAPTGDGATAEPTDIAATTAPGDDNPSTLPDLPPNTTAVSEFHPFGSAEGQGSILFTADITQTIPDGAKTYWYTYVGGQWQQLQEAYISGLRTKTAQGSFDTTPKNLVVLALTA